MDKCNCCGADAIELVSVFLHKDGHVSVRVNATAIDGPEEVSDKINSIVKAGVQAAFEKYAKEGKNGNY